MVFFFHSITIHAAEYIDELIIRFITVILFRFERCSDSICSKRGFPFFRVIRERGHQENIYKLKLKCDPCKLLHPMFVKKRVFGIDYFFLPRRAWLLFFLTMAIAGVTSIF